MRFSFQAAFKVIEEEHGVTINFSPDMVKDRQATDYFREGTSAPAALGLLLFGSGLTFKGIEGDNGHWTYLIMPGQSGPTSLVGRTVVRHKVGHEQTHDLPVPDVRVASRQSGQVAISDHEGYFTLSVKVGDYLVVRDRRQQYPKGVELTQSRLRDTLLLVLPESAAIYPPNETCPEQDTTKPPILPGELSPSDILATRLQGVLHYLQAGSPMILQNVQDIMALSGTGEPDLLRAMSSFPGLSTLGESVGNLSIRGGQGDQNLIRYDGITVYHATHMFGLQGAFNHRSINRTEVIPGHFQARYGGRTSGVINVQGRPGHPHRVRPSFGYGANLMSMSLSLETPLSFGQDKAPVAVMMAARRSISDLLFSPTGDLMLQNRLQSTQVQQSEAVVRQDSSQAQYWRDIAEPRFNFWDANAKVVWAINAQQLLSVSALNSRDQLHYRVSRPGLNDSQLESLKLLTQGLSANWDSYWRTRNGVNSDSQLYSQTTLALSRYRNAYTYELSLIGLREQDFAAYDLVEQSLRHLTRWQLGPQQWVEGGLDYSRLGLAQTMHSSLSHGMNLDTTHRAQLYSHFGQYRVQLPRASGTEFWELILGLRHTHFSADQRHYWEPRAELSYTFGDGMKLHGTAGQYVQFVRWIQTFNQLNVGQQVFALAGQQDLPVLRARHFSLGGSYSPNFTPGREWTFSLDGYYKRYQGVAMYGFEQELVPNGARPEHLFTDGTGWVRGLDAMFKYSLGRVHPQRPDQMLLGVEGWISYSLSQATNEFDDLVNGNPFPAATDQRHQLSLVNNVSFFDGAWVFSSNFTYASGRPFTPLAEVDQQGFLTRLGFDPVHSGRLPAYHRLDLSLHHQHTLGGDWLGEDMPPVKGRIGVVIFNVYDRTNIGQRQYRVPRVSEEAAMPPMPVILDHQLLGFSPNIFINLEF